MVLRACLYAHYLVYYCIRVGDCVTSFVTSKQSAQRTSSRQHPGEAYATRSARVTGGKHTEREHLLLHSAAHKRDVNIPTASDAKRKSAVPSKDRLN
jgi:hypothetical protein